MKHTWLIFSVLGFLGVCVMVLFFVRLQPIKIPSVIESNKQNTISEPIITTANPQKGPLDAKITIVEYSDFQCAACRDISSTLDIILNTYPNDVRIVWKNFPNESLHPLATKSAEAAICARDQGVFWAYHDEIFRRQVYLSESEFITIANDLKIDENKFKKCLENSDSLPFVRRDFEEALGLGLTATPTLIIGDKQFVGAVSLDELNNYIRSILQK